MTEHHHEAIDAKTKAARGRHAVRERADVVRVVVHRLVIALGASIELRLEATRLILRIIELGESVGDFAPIDKELKAIGDRRLLVIAACER